MNQYKHDTNAAGTSAEPLFASVWLALYYGLRKNYNERQIEKSVDSAPSQAQSKKQ